MLASTLVSNEQNVSWLKLWNQFGVLKETAKFPKQGFSDGTFDKWFHKAIFWSQVNPFPIQEIQVFIFNAIEN
jgi:hypothetical protein